MAIFVPVAMSIKVAEGALSSCFRFRFQTYLTLIGLKFRFSFFNRRAVKSIFSNVRAKLTIPKYPCCCRARGMLVLLPCFDGLPPTASYIHSGQVNFDGNIPFLQTVLLYLDRRN